ncbi:MAG: hypothetical protein J07HR59_00304 [Halorubrum sp. J07HR59]|nr:MAG: hypothetical protein J07HR59_00304 [Halorubrum sp. J07HR59]
MGGAVGTGTCRSPQPTGPTQQSVVSARSAATTSILSPPCKTELLLTVYQVCRDTHPPRGQNHAVVDSLASVTESIPTHERVPRVDVETRRRRVRAWTTAGGVSQRLTASGIRGVLCELVVVDQGSCGTVRTRIRLTTAFLRAEYTPHKCRLRSRRTKTRFDSQQLSSFRRFRRRR